MEKFTELELAEGKHLPATGRPDHGRYPLHLLFRAQHKDEVTINFDRITRDITVGSVPATPADMARIAKEGFGAVLDLCGDSRDEAKWAEKHGIQFLHEFVYDGHTPTQEQFRKLVGWIHGNVEQGKRVYIHCHAGAGRAPTVAAAYLIRAHKLTVQRACEILQACRRVYFVSQRQMLGLSTYKQSLVENN